jgi:hypothetical protein
MTKDTVMLSGFYAECHLCWVSCMLSVSNKPINLGVITLNVVMQNVQTIV